MMYLQLVGGFVVLLASAEVLVRGAVSLARILNIPPLVIGMTVVAIGTSAPELVVTIDAVLTGATGLALGNVIGSNIANVLLILGCCCLAFPTLGSPNVLKRDSIVLMGGSAVFALLCAQGELGLWSGMALFALFAVFLVSSYRSEAEDEEAAAEHIREIEEIQVLPGPAWSVTLVIIAGLAGVVWGADLLVQGAVAIARTFGVSGETIGLTVIALGTSLPELAASMVAAFRGHPDIAIGNVVGSNLFNILGIAGLAAMVTPIPVNSGILTFDIWVMLGATVLMLPVLAGRWHPGRAGGAILLVLYVAFIAYHGHAAGLFSGG